MYLLPQEQTCYLLPLSFVSYADFFFFSPLAQSSSVVVLAPLSSSSSGSSEGWDCSVFSSSSSPSSLHPSGWCPAPPLGCGCSAAGPGWPALPAGRPGHGRGMSGWVCPAQWCWGWCRVGEHQGSSLDLWLQCGPGGHTHPHNKINLQYVRGVRVLHVIYKKSTFLSLIRKSTQI